MMSVIKRIILLFVALSLAGCDAFSSEPVYSGISVEGMNYTPFNLTKFVIRDKYGNTASGGGDLMPGAGEGSLSCCYKLKGTDFTVDWEIYDADEAIKNIYAPIKKIHKTTQVHFPKTKISGGAGEVVLAVHFYPDDHIEFEIRNDLSGSRIAYDDVWDWLRKQHKQLINPNNDDDSVVFRRVAKLASQGWLKHGFTNTVDLQQYCYFFLLNPMFDKRPEVEKILRKSNGKPGAFGAAMEKLPDTVIQEIKSNHFEHVPTGAEHG
ncbi:DUF3304 domain-containing protein [Burkholderia glumae]|uniref:DUF3304 domain-containing protein n=1 Tax=Burkholderia glumae TaxID=337 RepID=UPI002151EDB2|nr:DUF3304 domain-containing protein [Burkholderia glumae]